MKKRIYLTLTLTLTLCLLSSCGQKLQAPLDGSIVETYVTEFNSHDEELYKEYYDNSVAATFLKENVPYFECPDKEFEKTYYFRWWVYRKHLRKTKEGFVVTEFMPQVSWANKNNSINCPAALQIEEGRWLRDKSIIADYLRSWMAEDANVRQYCFPIADALYQYELVAPNDTLVNDMYDFLKGNFAEWEKMRLDSTGLFWQRDLADGMEGSISGKLSPDETGYRPTINSYMYADAVAISRFAAGKNLSEDLSTYTAKADGLKQNVERLWDAEAQFYKVIPRHRDMSFSPAREEIGYIPWLYDLPDVSKTVAWKHLSDPDGFYAPYGPTTAERRAEGFDVMYEVKPGTYTAQWNGPSWPYSTSQTLGALACCLRRIGETEWADKNTFFDALNIYSNCHRYTNANGEVVCWIDENIDPFTGTWLCRTKNIARGSTSQGGKDYNHSSFCDLVISDLIGINPQSDGNILIEPLLPEDSWDYFCLQDVVCAGRSITVIYDKTGEKYGQGMGLSVFVDGKLKAHSEALSVKLNV